MAAVDEQARSSTRSGARGGSTRGAPAGGACRRRGARRLDRPHRRLAVVALSAAAALPLVVATAGLTPASAASRPSRSSSAGTLNIGVIADEVGVEAPTVMPQVRGMLAWQKVTDARGGLDGHHVSLDVCNSGSTVTGSLLCAGKLASTGIVIDVGTTGEVAAVAPQLQSAGKVVLTPDPTLNPSPGSNIFQTVPELATGVRTFLGAAVSNHINAIGLITTDDASGVAIQGAVHGAAAHFGLSVTGELIAPDTTDATVQVEQLAAAHVGMIYDGVVGLTGTVVLKAIKEVGLRLPVVVNAGDVYPSFLAAASGSVPGRIYGAPPSNLAVPGLLNTGQHGAFVRFEALYKKVTGSAMNLVTTNFIGVVQASTAAQILLGLKGNSAPLARTEKYLLSRSIGGVIPIRFATSGPQVVVQVVGLAEATGSSKLWSACVSSSLLRCP